MKQFRLIVSCILVLCGHLAAAQTAKETAFAKAEEAVRLEDKEGKYAEAIALFEEAAQLDPENILYHYEKAYAYNGLKEYGKAAAILEKLQSHKDVHARVYQMLGNVYDMQGDPKKAIRTYEAGLKKFPASGELYLERGNMHLIEKEYEKALSYYEKGIEADPKFPSNYYRAAKLYCSSSEAVWGMIYGELFMNLERGSPRTEEMSKLLYDTYRKSITITSDTSFGVSFSKYNTISVEDIKDTANFRLPFGMGLYEMLMMMAIVGEQEINIASLNNIRSTFLTSYFNGTNEKKYPNILFDYMKKVKDAGHLTAYNHWILNKGDVGAEQWVEAHRTEWTDFIKWFGANGLVVDRNNRFYRGQY